MRRCSQEVGVGINDDVVRVRVSELYYRPAEVDLLIGNPAKAVQHLGWNPQCTPFEACFAPTHRDLCD